MTSFKHIHLVVNTASGPEPPPTQALRAMLADARVAWQMHTVTERADPVTLAERAVEAGADIVVACGGDGTVRAVAIALEGTGVPLGIIPTGSANVLSKDLGIPADPARALALILAEQPCTQPLDLGCVESPTERDGRFILRVGMGWQAAWSQTVPEAEKDALGGWAYLVHAFRLRRELRPDTYRLTLDGGDPFEVDGVTLLVCSSANVGVPGFRVVPGATPSDGLLHVVVLREADWGAIFKLMGYTLASPLHTGAPPETPESGATLAHWSAKTVTVECDTTPVAACDGEALDSPFPLRAHILPQALRVVVAGA